MQKVQVNLYKTIHIPMLYHPAINKQNNKELEPKYYNTIHKYKKVQGFYINICLPLRRLGFSNHWPYQYRTISGQNNMSNMKRYSTEIYQLASIFNTTAYLLCIK